MSTISSNTPPETAVSTLKPGSVPSCLRNKNDPTRKHPLDKRVIFPKDDQQMVTGFMEPANPWEYAENVNKDDLRSQYISSCEKHGTKPLSKILSQLQILDCDLERNECLDLRGEILGPAACETLEEILKRVQYVTINLECTNLDDESSVALFDMMEYYESAVRLNITGNHCIAARGWQACSRMIKRTKCLEELDARNTTLNEQYMPILSRAMRLSPQLHVLKLENCNLSGRPIVILAAALKLNTGLKELYLGENYLTENDATQLSALLKVNTVLQLLDISNNNIKDEGLSHIVEGLLEQNSTGGGLQVLVLWNNHLSRSCGHHLSRIFNNSTSLETINIGQNVLSNEVLHVNKLALQKNRTLLRLGMQSTHLTCEGTVALAEIIADNPTIQRIDLRDNNLQVAGLMALVLSMRVNKSVTQLDLDDTPRRKHSMGPALDEYIRLVAEIRSHCAANLKNTLKSSEMIEVTTKEETAATVVERRSRAGSFAARKISLTCETLARNQAMPPPDTVPQLLTEPKRSGGRLRSPAPSPIPSPVASPSPTRSRFQVSRVSESDSPNTPPSSSPNVFFGSSSRFKVTMVDSGSSSNPPTVVTSNNVTMGFDTCTLSPNISVSPAPSPTPIPAPLLSSIPSLFPTPMPSPMPSPLVSPSPSPTYISPLSTINVGEVHLTPTTGTHNKSPQTVDTGHPPPVIITDSVEDNTVDKHKETSHRNESVCRTLESDKTMAKINEVEESNLSCTDLNYEKESISPMQRFSPRNSASPPKVTKIRSESGDSEKDLYLNRKLPKATDSLDLSTLRVMKQASVSVPDKSSSASQRVRKISAWVQPSSMFSSITQDDSGKTGSSLERLLEIFKNPFSRTKTEEETTQPLEQVPEVVESTNQTSIETTEPTITQDTQSHIETTNSTYSNVKETLILESLVNNLQLHKTEPSYENEKIDSIISPATVASDGNCDVTTGEVTTSNGNGCGVKCETWPQGSDMSQVSSMLQQAHSHSSPRLHALFFLKGNVPSNLSAEIKKMSPPGSEEAVDSTKNISLAL